MISDPDVCCCACSDANKDGAITMKELQAAAVKMGVKTSPSKTLFDQVRVRELQPLPRLAACAPACPALMQRCVGMV